jgi:hypothetical protein
MPSGKSSISIAMHKDKLLVAFYIESNNKTKFADARIFSYSIDMATTQSIIPCCFFPDKRSSTNVDSFTRSHSKSLKYQHRKAKFSVSMFKDERAKMLPAA